MAAIDLALVSVQALSANGARRVFGIHRLGQRDD